MDLQKQITAAEKAGPVQLARAFVVLHRLNERMLSDEKSFKQFKSLWKETKELTVPQCFEQSGVDSIPLSEGFRVGTSVRIMASVVSGQKEAAFAWLRENEAGELIQPTLNASTLSAFAKQRGEKNEELPEELFKVYDQPNTSVTKT